MTPLKSDTVYAALSDRGFIEGDREGLFRFDTRIVGRYAWRLDGFRLLAQSAGGERLEQAWSRLAGRDQQVGLRRRFILTPDGFEDRLTFTNTSLEPQLVETSLEARAHFADVYTLTPIWGRTRPDETAFGRSDGELLAEHAASDGVRSSVRISLSPCGEDGRWRWTLPPGGSVELAAEGRLHSSLGTSGPATRPDLGAWREAFAAGPRRPAVDQALGDVHALLTSWNGRTVVAAGVPWFVCLFGRDSLITARFCLDFAPWLARNVLFALAEAQGAVEDPYREEQPGKIPHVQRRSELARTGQVPFGRYYGTADATPLWIWLLSDYVAATGDLGTLRALDGPLQAALGWLRSALKPGFIRFAPHGGGLKVQSWKDSSDSMSHADGRLAEPPIAPVEVQAYAQAALSGAAALQRQLGREAEAAVLEAEAEALRGRFEQAFWLERLGTYAMALDGEGRPLEVLASNAGHVLWSGAAAPDRAARTATTLLSEILWSGWGLRTLGTGERRYNPVSYHNGGVWPHDTAVFGAGLHRYGLLDGFGRVLDAMRDLADAAPDRRLPELIAGHAREAVLPPIPDPMSCRPQAWSAASLLALERLAGTAGRPAR